MFVTFELASVTNVFWPPTMIAGGRTALLELNALCATDSGEPTVRNEPAASEVQLIVPLATDALQLNSDALLRAVLPPLSSVGASGWRSVHCVRNAALRTRTT